MRLRILSLLTVAGLGLACTEPVLAPEAISGTDSQFHSARNGARENAAVYWNEVARALVSKHASNPYQAIRTYAIISVAQYNGAVAGEPPRRGRRAFERAAITRASVDVLTYAYPDEADALEAKAETFLASGRGRRGDADEEEAGEAAGAAAAAQMVERARTDGWFTPWTGTVPTGPGIWFSSAVPAAPPVLPLLGQAKTFLMPAGNLLRPAAPPAFGSPAFDAAVAEVRRFADARTAKQDSIAKFWAFPGGTYTPFGYWNEEAARLAVRRGLSDVRSAHLFALMNMVGADGVIASHDAKYAYWLMRPSQADPGISLAIGLPNFPSYISNHATLSGGMAHVIGAWFPSDRARLEALANQAAMSRLYGGIHYRFDNDTGLRIGRRIARRALAVDVRDGRPFILR